MPAAPAPFSRAEFESGERTVLNAGRWANAIVWRLRRPDGDWVFEAGDIVTQLGRPEDLALAEQRLLER